MTPNPHFSSILVMTKTLTGAEIRQKFIDYYTALGHAEVENASLIPANDTTTLFMGSGMQPLVPYLMGQPHPEGKKVVDSQPSIRVQDIEEVGDNRHTTFFEMLGNWSFGDYFKKEAIEYSFEFLTSVLKLDKDKLAVSCFAGDENASKDNESAKVWASLGIDKERIAFLGKNDKICNFYFYAIFYQSKLGKIV